MTEDLADILKTEGKSRCPIVDGIFYPDDDKLLKEEVRFLLEEVDDAPGSALGIVAPHAAFPFSGSLAAVAFNAAANRNIKNVVIIGPVHREEKDVVFLSESDSFLIPTGNIKINKTIVDRLLKADPCFVKNDVPHFEEHCIEVHLPFVRYLFPEADIVPMLVGSNNISLVVKTAKILRIIFSDKMDSTLFVASANMSTYLPEKEAKEYCRKLTALVEEADIKKIYEEIERGNAKAKGIGCISILLSLAGEKAKIRVLRKKDSSKYGCENSNIVCYAAISIE